MTTQHVWLILCKFSTAWINCLYDSKKRTMLLGESDQDILFMPQSNSSHFYINCPAVRTRKIWLIAGNCCAKDKPKNLISVRRTGPFILLNPFSKHTVYSELLCRCFVIVLCVSLRNVKDLRDQNIFIKSLAQMRRGVAEQKDFVYKQHLQGGFLAPCRESPLSLFWKQQPAQVSQQHLVTCACFSCLSTTFSCWRYWVMVKSCSLSLSAHVLLLFYWLLPIYLFQNVETIQRFEKMVSSFFFSLFGTFQSPPLLPHFIHKCKWHVCKLFKLYLNVLGFFFKLV